MKSVLSAIFTIALVSVLVGAGTFAYYTDTEVSSDNTFTAGEFDLFLTNGQVNPNAQWTISQGAPGDFIWASTNGHIRIHNLGSIEADHVDITFSLDKYEDDDGNAGNGLSFGPDSDLVDGVGTMASALKVYSMIYEVTLDGTPTDYIPLVMSNGVYWYDSNYLTDTNGNGYIDLADLENPVNDLFGLPAPIALNADEPNYSDYTQLGMSISLEDTGVPQNEFQGDIIDMTIMVTLNQDSTQ